MNQLSGKYVNVILSVEEGKGMDFVKNQMHLTANFNNRLLESDKAKPEERIPFNTELIWEIEKKDLRKIRTQNQPLRIECISTDPYNRTERVGFLLLSLRSAQVIPIKEAKTPVIYHWQKLVGCQADKKRYHPELYVALTIRDHLLNEPEESVNNVPFISEEESVENQVGESAFPLTFLPDGFIRVGEDSKDLESISFNLLVKEARNMDCLLPEVMVFKQNQEKYHMSFKIFGVSLRTKPFYKELHDSIVLNEKVVVRMLSTQETLEEFFKTQSVTVNFFSGHDKLGTTEVDLNGVSFEEREDKYYFKMASPNTNVIFGEDAASPFIDVKIWLKRSGEKVSKIMTYSEEGQTIEKTITTNSRAATITKNHLKASGDQGSTSALIGKLEKVSARSKSECESLDHCENDVISITRSVDTVIKKIPLSPKLAVKHYGVADNYKKFIVELTIHSLVWKKPPKRNKVVFKFLHPKAYSCLNVFTALEMYVDKKIPLNISVKMVYISTPSEIENVLKVWPPRLVLTDEDEHCLCQEIGIKQPMIFNNEFTEIILVSNTRSSPEALAKLDVKVKFNISDFRRCDEKSDLYLNPPIIDEFLTLTEIADIETWKKTQKEEFEKHLEQTRENEIEKVKLQFKEERSALKQKLNDQIDKCQTLQESMKVKMGSIQTEKYLRLKQGQSGKFQEILNENLERYNASEHTEIIRVLSSIQRDNEFLRQLVEDQRRAIETYENTKQTKQNSKHLLTKLRTLEEQFEEVQQEKESFEEQWKKTYDDLEQINNEYEQQLQSYTAASSEGEEMSNLNLEDVCQNSENNDTPHSESSD